MRGWMKTARLFRAHMRRYLQSKRTDERALFKHRAFPPARVSHQSAMHPGELQGHRQMMGGLEFLY